MNPRKFALVAGWIMLVMGAFALIPSIAGSSNGLIPLTVDTSYGWAYGLFPMNIFNKVALIIFGVAGIGASRERALRINEEATVVGGNGWTEPPADPFANSVLWSRVVCVTMGVLAILGMFRATNTLSGVWPLYSGEVAAHGIFAILGGIYGFSSRSRVAAMTHHHLRDNVHPINDRVA